MMNIAHISFIILFSGCIIIDQSNITMPIDETKMEISRICHIWKFLYATRLEKEKIYHQTRKKINIGDS